MYTILLYTRIYIHKILATIANVTSQQKYIFKGTIDYLVTPP